MVSSRLHSTVVRPDIPTNLDDIKTSSLKEDSDFRVYSEASSERVVNHYRDMRTNQTVAFYESMEKKYSFENGSYRRLMTMEEAFAELEHYVVSLTVGSASEEALSFGCFQKNPRGIVLSLKRMTHICPIGRIRSRFGFAKQAPLAPNCGSDSQSWTSRLVCAGGTASRRG